MSEHTVELQDHERVSIESGRVGEINLFRLHVVQADRPGEWTPDGAAVVRQACEILGVEMSPEPIPEPDKSRKRRTRDELHRDIMEQAAGAGHVTLKAVCEAQRLKTVSAERLLAELAESGRLVEVPGQVGVLRVPAGGAGE